EGGGLYGPQSGNTYTPTFTEALGQVSVERGARIATHAPGSVTEGGGYVLLLGQEARNAGTIHTPRGQTLLAAGDAFVIRKGLVTDASQGGTTYSTTRGNEVAPRADAALDVSRIDAAISRGQASNSGLILAAEGDITLTGRDVRLGGTDALAPQSDGQAWPGSVTLASTSVNARGAIHLLNSVSDSQGRITLAPGAVAAVVAGELSLDEAGRVSIGQDGATALDSQRLALIEESARQDVLRGQAPELAPGQAFDNLWQGQDRRDQSRIEIVTGGVVDFQGHAGDIPGSLALATGGQIAVAAGRDPGAGVDPASGAGRVQVREGAQLDVSGSVGVRLAMAENAIRVDIQGNELRDAPRNRDSDPENDRSLLSSLGVWVDRRLLVATEDGLLYTANGLLEVSGWLANTPSGIGHWTAQGGTVSLRGGQVLTQEGSEINLAGGTVDVLEGYINQSWLRGADGRLYEVSQAPADVVYTGLYQGYESVHARWGENATRRFYNPLVAPARRWETGYTVGRDAGRLVIDAPTAVLQGEVDAQAYQGARQWQRPDAALRDAYLQSHYAVARPGALVLGRHGYQTNGRMAGRIGVYETDLHIGQVAPIGLDLDAPDALHAAPERANTVWLDTDWVNAQGFGVLDLAVGGTVTVGGAPGAAVPSEAPGAEGSAPAAQGPSGPALQVADGGQIRLTGSVVDIRGEIVARGGRIAAGNLFTPSGSRDETVAAPGQVVLSPSEGEAAVTLHEGARLDVRGLWVNLLQDPQAAASLAWTDGGTVELASSQHVAMAPGSVIDASGGAAVLRDETIRGGAGGSVALLAVAAPGFVTGAGVLTLDGEVRAYGVQGSGSGTLRLQTGEGWSIGGELIGPDGELPAGETARIDLVLTEPLTVAAGQRLPMPTAYTEIRAGQVLDTTIHFTNTGATLSVPVGPGGWDLNGTNMDVYVGSTRYQGSTGNNRVVPEGAVITRINAGALPAGYEVPASLAFLPTPAYTVAAGTPALTDTVYEAGTVLPAGSVHHAGSLAVSPVAQFDADKWLHAGFSHYEIAARRGVAVLDGARLQPGVPVYRPTAQALQTGGREAGPALELVRELPLFMEDPARGVLSQRAGASLTLLGGSAGTQAGVRSDGGVHLGRDAEIVVDPGQRVTLGAGGQVTIEGRIEAPGGLIEVLNLKDKARELADRPNGRSVWIGGHAELDAAGRAYTAIDAQGLRYGTVLAGGQIVLGSRDGHYVANYSGGDEGLERAADAYVVVRDGALLDVSGAQAVLDAPASRQQGAAVLWGAARPAVSAVPHTVATDGGRIAMRSYYGIYNEGTMRAHGGGANASGGELSLSLEGLVHGLPNGSTPLPVELDIGRVLFIGQDELAWRLAGEAVAGQAHDSLALGRASLSAAQLAAGGFDSLSLMGRSAIAFDGDVDLALGRSLTLRRGVLMAVTPGAQVRLSAPYVLLDGQAPVTLPLNHRAAQLGLPEHFTDGAVTVEGGLIDVRNRMQLLFDQATLDSRGDLRFLAPTAFDAAQATQVPRALGL
ncbi:hypothetical protein V8Z80_14670, partial [Orrella sp. JC864]